MPKKTPTTVTLLLTLDEARALNLLARGALELLKYTQALKQLPGHNGGLAGWDALQVLDDAVKKGSEKEKAALEKKNRGST